MDWGGGHQQLGTSVLAMGRLCVVSPVTAPRGYPYGGIALCLSPSHSDIDGVKYLGHVASHMDRDVWRSRIQPEDLFCLGVTCLPDRGWCVPSAPSLGSG